MTRTDRIGDLVLSTAVFPALREKFPKAWIACLTFPENREILEGNPFLDEVLLYEKKGREKTIPGNLRFAWFLARKRFDLAVHLHPTNRMHFVTWLAGIPWRIGWDKKMPWALTHAFPYEKKKGQRHEAEYNFDLLGPLGVRRPERLDTFFPVSPKARASLNELLFHLGIPRDRPRVVINPSASCPSKKWPAERFADAASRIASVFDVSILTIGTRADRPLTRKIQRLAGAPIHDLAGRLNLSMLAALLDDAALLISNDSGPVHIAASLATPVVSVFGRNDPGLSPVRWRPLGKHSRVVIRDVGCARCLAHRCPIHFLCLDAVSAGMVFREAADILNARLKTSCAGSKGPANT